MPGGEMAMKKGGGENECGISVIGGEIVG